MTNRNLRDEQGWRVPREGTLSYQIYMLTKQGRTPEEIAGVVVTAGTVKLETIRVLLHKMRHPEKIKRYPKKRAPVQPEQQGT